MPKKSGSQEQLILLADLWHGICHNFQEIQQRWIFLIQHIIEQTLGLPNIMTHFIPQHSLTLKCYPAHMGDTSKSDWGVILPT